MKIWKFNIIMSFILFLFIIGATAFFMHDWDTSHERTTIITSTNPNDDVKVGKIVLEKIHNETNITSRTYDISYPFEKGTLDKDSSFWDKVKYVVAGKSMSMQVYASYEFRDNLNTITKSDIYYDKSTHSLTITLSKPTLKVTLDKENTKLDSFVALFSSGFTEQERLRIYQQAEDAGATQIKKDHNNLTEGENDISDALTHLLTSIDSVKSVQVSFK